MVEPLDELEEIQCEEEPCDLKSFVFFYTPKTWKEPIPEPAKKKTKKLPKPILPKEEPDDETNEIMSRLMDAVKDYKVGLYKIYN